MFTIAFSAKNRKSSCPTRPDVPPISVPEHGEGECKSRQESLSKPVLAVSARSSQSGATVAGSDARGRPRLSASGCEAAGHPL